MRSFALLLLAVTACSKPPSPPSPAASTSVADNGVVALTLRQVDSWPFSRIDIQLTNLSSSTLQLDPNFLPWVGPLNLGVHAIGPDAKPLTLVSPLWDPPARDPLPLPPGMSSSGTLDLAELIPDLEQALAAGSVRVHWFYPRHELPDLPSLRIGPRLSGTILLRRGALDPGPV